MTPDSLFLPYTYWTRVTSTTETLSNSVEKGREKNDIKSKIDSLDEY